MKAHAINIQSGGELCIKKLAEEASKFYLEHAVRTPRIVRSGLEAMGDPFLDGIVGL